MAGIKGMKMENGLKKKQKLYIVWTSMYANYYSLVVVVVTIILGVHFLLNILKGCQA